MPLCFTCEVADVIKKPIKELVRKRMRPEDISRTSTKNRVEKALDSERSDRAVSERAPAYVADLPDGRLIYSAIVAHHRLWGYTKRSRTLELIAGVIDGNAHNPFETRAARISQSLLTDCDGGRGTLLRHTLLGYFARTMDEGIETEVLSELLQGNRSVASKYFRTAQEGKLASPILMWCKTCASIDYAESGLTHWYVVHQLPFVTHCHHHYRRLVCSCETCRTRSDDGTRWTLPGDGCKCIRHVATACQTVSEELSANDPYRFLLNDVVRVFEGHLPDLRPCNWRTWMRTVVPQFGSLKQANRKLSEAIRRSWSHSQQRKIAAEVSTLIEKDGVEKELRMLARPREVLLRLVIWRATSDLLHNNDPSVPKKRIEVSDQVLQLEGHLESRGLPAGAATLLLEGKSMHDVAIATGTGTTTWMRALATLPQIIRDELAKERLRVGVRRSRAATPFNVPSRPTSDLEKRTVLRKKIRYLIDELGMTRRGQITALLGSARTWLLENDSEWLEKNLPPRRGGKVVRPRNCRRF